MLLNQSVQSDCQHFTLYTLHVLKKRIKHAAQALVFGGPFKIRRLDKVTSKRVDHHRPVLQSFGDK